jgi:hypothetical protein
MRFPTPAIMAQAIEIHGCNCDACCIHTPLARRRASRIRARLTQRAAELAKRSAQEKLSQAESVLREAGYTIVPPIR